MGPVFFLSAVCGGVVSALLPPAKYCVPTRCEGTWKRSEERNVETKRSAETKRGEGQAETTFVEGGILIARLYVYVPSTAVVAAVLPAHGVFRVARVVEGDESEARRVARDPDVVDAAILLEHLCINTGNTRGGEARQGVSQRGGACGDATWQRQL